MILTQISASTRIQILSKPVRFLFQFKKKKKKEENCIVMEMTSNLLLWTLTGPSVSVPYLPDIYTRAVILISCIPCEFPCCKEILILPVSSFQKTI